MYFVKCIYIVLLEQIKELRSLKVFQGHSAFKIRFKGNSSAWDLVYFYSY